MLDAGILRPEEHLELLEGEIIETGPEQSRHAGTVDLVAEALRKAFADVVVTVRVQHPLDLGELSQPEPDVAVVAGSLRDQVVRHPTSALLVVEVSDSSLEYDRVHKKAAYARAGIAEYWIVDLVAERLEVSRDPSPAGYRTTSTYGRGEMLKALAASAAAIAVADLLP